MDFSLSFTLQLPTISFEKIFVFRNKSVYGRDIKESRSSVALQFSARSCYVLRNYTIKNVFVVRVLWYKCMDISRKHTKCS